MPKYATEQERLVARIAVALKPHGIPISHALMVLTQATLMRLKKAAPTPRLTISERAAVILYLLRSPHLGNGVAAKYLNQMMPVMGMNEFAILLATPPAEVSEIEAQFLIASLSAHPRCS